MISYGEFSGRLFISGQGRREQTHTINIVEVDGGRGERVWLGDEGIIKRHGKRQGKTMTNIRNETNIPPLFQCTFVSN